MHETTRWGILGTGKIALAFATALRETPGARLAAVGSRSMTTAAAFCAEFSGTPHASYQALCADADVEVVYVGTPHSLHAANALLALEHGKHVLVEKPFTINRAEAEQVVAAARARGLFLMEAMWTRFLPSTDKVRELIAQGTIGMPRHIVADFAFPSPFGPEHRLHDPALGGGALLDIGIYPLAIAVDLLGPVVEAKAVTRLAPKGSDLQTAFSLRHEGGGICSALCAIDAWSPIELTVSGERGYIRMHTPFYKARQVTLVRADGSSDTYDTPPRGNGYVHEVIEVQRCVRAGLTESPRLPLSTTLHWMGVLDALRSQIGLRYEADA